MIAEATIMWPLFLERNKHMVKNRNLTRWVFVLPAIIIVGLLFVYPFFSSIYFSFTNKHLIMPRYKFVGLATLISTMPSLIPLSGQSFLFWDKCLLVLY